MKTSTTKTTHPSTAGADEHAPSFSAVLSPRDVLDMRLEIEAAGLDASSEYEQIQEERFRLARESMMRTIRMEAKRKDEARKCADKYAADLRAMHEEYKILKGLARMAFAFPLVALFVLWVVTR